MYYFLIIYLSIYCVLHSILADDRLMNRFYYRWWYRGFYVIQSILLLIPLWYIYRKIEDGYIFNPPLYGKVVLWLIFIFGVYFGYLASREYDNYTFLGVKQIKDFLLHKIEYQQEAYTLKTDGILGTVRHPYYFSGLLIIWARPLKIKDLIINIIFTIYFIIGALNEERKLKNKYGNTYKEYQKQVPMLIPDFKKFFNIFYQSRN